MFKPLLTVLTHVHYENAGAGAKESTFDVWMKQESDTVQALGMAYAERETIEACYRLIQEVPCPFAQCLCPAPIAFVHDHSS